MSKIHRYFIGIPAARAHAFGGRGRGRRARRRLALLAAIAPLAAFLVGPSTALATEPVATIGPPTGAAYTTAVPHGTLDPGGEGTTYLFQTVTQEQFEESVAAGSNGFDAAVTGLEGFLEGSGAQAIPPNPGEELTGLTPGKTYHYRVFAFNGSGFSEALEASTFTTEAVPAPTVTLDPVMGPVSSSATFVAHIDPNAPKPEAETDAAEATAFALHYHFACTPKCPGAEAEEVLPADDTDHQISVTAAGLRLNSSYSVRLIASNIANSVETPAQVFSTPVLAPSIEATEAEATRTEATLHARLNPGGVPVSYFFEWGPTVAYGQRTETRSLPTGQEAVPVSAQLTGLPEGTGFHFRLVATNSATTTRGSDAVFGTTVATSESCPNAAVRAEQGMTGLPDCRAYERVTPEYKEGYGLYTLSYSSDGDRAIVYGYPNLAGDPGTGEQGQLDNVYLLSRGSGGWQISGMNAPLSQFVGQVPLAAEADSGASLWVQHTPRQSTITRGLYIRSASGAYSYIGRLNPVAGPAEESNSIEASANNYTEPVAATSDYRHIVLEASDSENYWSFDTTKGNAGSLYEYSGTGNEHPILVAVEGSEKGNTHLIGECGSVLGGGQVDGGSAFNALSSDGETAFFTVEAGCGAPAPPTAEVYARVHGSLVSPAVAETIDISTTACTVVCGGESGKNFEGASADGKRVFFTSTQKLTNDAVDGTAGGDASQGFGCAVIAGSGCNLYEYDMAEGGPGQLRLVAGGDGVLGVPGVGENGTYTYFVARGALASAGPNPYGAAPVEGEANLYAYDAASRTTAFVATLGGGDEGDWSRRESTRAQLEQTAGNEGQFLVFPSSQSGLTDEVTTSAQLYEYDAQTGELVRVSKGEDGYDDDGRDVPSGLEASNFGRAFRSSTNSNAVAEDGRTVVFGSSGQLSPDAPAALVGCPSVFEFHSGGPISQGGVHLISDGRDVQPNKGSSCGVQFQAIDGEAGNILFSTDDPLVAADVDGVQRDIYDAREDGGFPGAGVVGESGSCPAEGCELPTPAGAALTPGSAAAHGASAVAKHPHKKKRHKRKHHKKGHHHKKQKRARSKNGGRK